MIIMVSVILSIPNSNFWKFINEFFSIKFFDYLLGGGILQGGLVIESRPEG